MGHDSTQWGMYMSGGLGGWEVVMATPLLYKV